jgi:hypothetical protein
VGLRVFIHQLINHKLYTIKTRFTPKNVTRLLVTYPVKVERLYMGMTEVFLLSARYDNAPTGQSARFYQCDRLVQFATDKCMTLSCVELFNSQFTTAV